MSIDIRFLGGAGTVTGSKFLIEHARGSRRTRILVDCGLFQGLKELRLLNRAPFPVEPSSIDAVLLTHAHLDHTGYLPLLFKNGFRGPVYCSHPTRDLAKLILMDSARLQEEDAAYANRIGSSKHAPALPLYEVRDALAAMKLFRPVARDAWHRIGNAAGFRLSSSGHILGSTFIELKIDGKLLVFSGDLGRSAPRMLPPPTRLERADYLFVESTYGDRTHTNESPLDTLARVTQETFKRKGHLLIPSFAVGRTQEILHLFAILKRQRRIPDVPIYLDSPLGIDATEIFSEYPDWHCLSEIEIEALYRASTLIRSQQQSRELLNKRKSSVVIAGSGMISGGRILHHLTQRLDSDRNTVLLTGFQAAGTRGRLLQDGATELKIFGQYYPVRARVETITGLSAHADQRDILSWLGGFRKAPQEVFIVHGEPQAADALRVRIADELGWKARIPRHGESIRLAAEAAAARSKKTEREKEWASA